MVAGAGDDDDEEGDGDDDGDGVADAVADGPVSLETEQAAFEAMKKAVNEFKEGFKDSVCGVACFMGGPRAALAARLSAALNLPGGCKEADHAGRALVRYTARSAASTQAAADAKVGQRGRAAASH